VLPWVLREASPHRAIELDPAWPLLVPTEMDQLLLGGELASRTTEPRHTHGSVRPYNTQVLAVRR
jgi:hypothetical protein